jgi:hypothetical protein
VRDQSRIQCGRIVIASQPAVVDKPMAKKAVKDEVEFDSILVKAAQWLNSRRI